MHSFSYGGFGLIESLFPVIFITMFLIVIGVFIFTAVRGMTRYTKNQASPVLTVDAKVVAKRTKVFHRNRGADDMSYSGSSYYATFEVESGDRMELAVSGMEYGMLAEGDVGKLTFQGTRYLGLERRR